MAAEGRKTLLNQPARRTSGWSAGILPARSRLSAAFLGVPPGPRGQDARAPNRRDRGQALRSSTSPVIPRETPVHAGVTAGFIPRPGNHRHRGWGTTAVVSALATVVRGGDARAKHPPVRPAVLDPVAGAVAPTSCRAIVAFAQGAVIIGAPTHHNPRHPAPEILHLGGRRRQDVSGKILWRLPPRCRKTCLTPPTPHAARGSG